MKYGDPTISDKDVCQETRGHEEFGTLFCEREAGHPGMCAVSTEHGVFSWRAER